MDGSDPDSPRPSSPEPTSPEGEDEVTIEELIERDTQREPLANFTISLAAALVPNTPYATRHPSAQRAVKELVEAFATAMKDRTALSFVAVPHGEQREMLVEGFFPFPAPLLKVLPRGTAALHTPRVQSFFTRQQIFSLTLLESTTGADVEALLEVLVKVATGEARDLRDALRRRKLAGISLLFEQDKVASARRELTWETVFALSRLRKLLAELASDERLPRSQRNKKRDRQLAAALAPLRRGDMIAPTLLNLELIVPDLKRQGVELSPAALIARLPAALCAEVLIAFSQLRSQPSSRNAHSEQAMSELTKLIVSHLAEDDQATTVDFVEEQLQAGRLLSEELPTSLRKRLDLRLKARRVLSQSDMHLRALNLENPTEVEIATLSQHLDDYRALNRELLHIEGDRFLAQVMLGLHALLQRDGTPRGVRAVAAETLRATALPRLVDTLVEMLVDPDGDRDNRAMVAEVLPSFGHAGLSALVKALVGSTDRWLRRKLGEVLQEVGIAAEPYVLEHLGDSHAPWFVLRNLLSVLEHVGTARSETAAACLLDHQDARVRAMAIGAYAKLSGDGAESALLHALSDDEDDVVLAAIEQLGKRGCRHAELGKLYAAILDPDGKDQYSDAIRMKACVALARTGNFSLEGGTDIEQLLCRALGGKQRRILFMKLPRASHFGLETRQLLCQLLGQIGGQHALEVLEDSVGRGEAGLRQEAEGALGKVRVRLEGGDASEAESADDS